MRVKAGKAVGNKFVHACEALDDGARGSTAITVARMRCLKLKVFKPSAGHNRSAVTGSP